MCAWATGGGKLLVRSSGIKCSTFNRAVTLGSRSSSSRMASSGPDESAAAAEVAFIALPFSETETVASAASSLSDEQEILADAGDLKVGVALIEQEELCHQPTGTGIRASTPGAFPEKLNGGDDNADQTVNKIGQEVEALSEEGVSEAILGTGFEEEEATAADSFSKVDIEGMISGVVNIVLDESLKDICKGDDDDDDDIEDFEADDAAAASAPPSPPSEPDVTNDGGGQLPPPGVGTAHQQLAHLKKAARRTRSRVNTGDSGVSLTSFRSGSRTSSISSAVGVGGGDGALLKPLAIVVDDQEDNEDSDRARPAPLSPTTPTCVDASALSDVFRVDLEAGHDNDHEEDGDCAVKQSSLLLKVAAKNDDVIGSDDVTDDVIKDEKSEVKTQEEVNNNVAKSSSEEVTSSSKDDDKSASGGGYFNELFPKLTLNKEKWLESSSRFANFDPTVPASSNQSMSGFKGAMAYSRNSFEDYMANLSINETLPWSGEFANTELRRHDASLRMLEKEQWMYLDYYGSAATPADKYRRHHQHRFTSSISREGTGPWASSPSTPANVRRQMDLVEWMVRVGNADIEDDPNILMYEHDIPNSGAERERCAHTHLKMAIRMYNSMPKSGGSSSGVAPYGEVSTANNNHRMFRPLPPPAGVRIPDRHRTAPRVGGQHNTTSYSRY